MGRESHFTAKKPRVFVRGMQGHYNLKEELARLRSMPRVVRGRELKFNDGPQTFGKHFVEPVDGLTQTLHVHLEEYAPGGHNQKHGHVNEAALLHSGRRGLRDSRRHPLRLEGRRHRCRPQQLRAPAFQRERNEPGPRARDEDEADVPVHEHAVSADGGAASDRAGAGRRGVRGARGTELQPR